ncbi:uncharacterized protein LY89DRAFT_732218 [Mollisia scopiformis]|uniref:Uncharacterized protein n=1 Tax=Mollisia scopiformis TaxID=149040 RepID=A0A194XFW2_MOLSC|nr:uncharacterized protein LY89DRAFT_732218 [Mollisia scopiformis]KUJ18662.1 hypothetical protein LY89DRAFT_732218 [Mollisia scopiformis]
MESRILNRGLIVELSQAIDRGCSQVRDKIRRAAFEELKRLKGEELVIIMTDCISNDNRELRRFEEHANIARARNVPLFTINLHCDAEGWLLYGKTDLINVDVLARLRQNFEYIDAEKIHEYPDVKIFHLNLDISEMWEEEAAEKIRDFLQSPF